MYVCMVGPAWKSSNTPCSHTVRSCRVTDHWGPPIHPSIHPSFRLSLNSRSFLQFDKRRFHHHHHHYYRSFGFFNYWIGASLHSLSILQLRAPTHVLSSSLRVAAGESTSRPTGDDQSETATCTVAWDRPLLFSDEVPHGLGTDILCILQMLYRMQPMCELGGY